MTESVPETLAAVISAFWNASDKELQKDFDHKAFYEKCVELFNGEPNFIQKLEALDELVDDYPEIASIREYLVDLLFIHFFNEDVQRLEADYLDSPEWERIEDETIDRGTELLNLHLYINECKEEDEQAELSHFLKEFLLVDEDEFQDEYKIYESVIANQILVEAQQSEIAKVYEGLSENDDIKDVFYPLMTFFSNIVFEQENYEEYLKFSKHKNYDAAVLAGIYSYHHGNALFPKTFINCKN